MAISLCILKFCLASYPPLIQWIYPISQRESYRLMIASGTHGSWWTQVHGGYCYYKNTQDLKEFLCWRIPKCFIKSISHASKLPCEVGQYYYPILTEGKLRHIIVKWLAQGHTASQWHSGRRGAGLNHPRHVDTLLSLTFHADPFELYSQRIHSGY